MALRNILTVEEPVLHKTARPVTRFDAHLGELLDDMRQTLTNAGGVGLAAPQIGILRRVVVVDGNWFEAKGEGLTARCFAHECDHLDGHIYTEIAYHMLTDEEMAELEEEA